MNSAHLIWCLLLLPFCFSAELRASASCQNNNNITIHETVLDTPIFKLFWLRDTTTVFAITTGYHLWVSKNGGGSWVDQTNKMPNATTKVNGRSGISNVIMSASNSMIYVTGFGEIIWVTQNQGDSWIVRKPTTNNFHFDTSSVLTPHPTESDWVLTDGPSNGCLDSRLNQSCFRTLWLSQDAATTWLQLETYVQQFTWGNAGLYGVNIQSIWYLFYADKTGNQRFKNIYTLEFAHSTDFLRSHDEDQDDIIFMLHALNTTFLAQKVDASSPMSILISEDNGVTFYKANFPLDLPENRYVIMQYTDVTYIAVAHGSNYWYHVYSSEGNGTDFALALPYVKIDGNAFPYFRRISSLPGWFLANQYQDVVGNNAGTTLVTQLTHNDGGEWTPINIPVYNDNSPIPCDVDNCSLNLFLESKPGFGTQSPYPPITVGPIDASHHAIGRMTATGNIGDDLDRTETNLQTYYTRDAGFTWYQVALGNNMYEMSDHGGIGILLDFSKKTSSLSYTWDEFYSLTECTFTDSPFQLINIVSDPAGTSQDFIVHGKRNSAGVVFHVEFSSILERQCDATDFENWSPFGMNDSEHCILGEKTLYSRRRRLAACWNGDNEEVVSSTPCKCTFNDYECDECYELVNGVCQLQPDCIDPTTINCTHGLLKHTVGYRRIPGDHCTGKTSLDPTFTDCRSESTGHSTGNQSSSSGHRHSSSAGVAVLVIFLVLAIAGVAVGTVWYLNKKKNLFQIKSFNPLPMSAMYENGESSTALDDDLLEQREAEPIEEEDIENFSSKTHKIEETDDLI